LVELVHSSDAARHQRINDRTTVTVGSCQSRRDHAHRVIDSHVCNTQAVDNMFLFKIIHTKISSFAAHAQQLPRFHLARLDTTRSDSIRSTCRAHAFWLCRHCRTAQLDSLDTTSSTGSTRRSRLARHDESDSQLSLLCNFYKVMITVIHVLFNVSHSLLYWF